MASHARLRVSAVFLSSMLFSLLATAQPSEYDYYTAIPINSALTVKKDLTIRAGKTRLYMSADTVGGVLIDDKMEQEFISRFKSQDGDILDKEAYTQLCYLEVVYARSKDRPLKEHTQLIIAAIDKPRRDKQIPDPLGHPKGALVFGFRFTSRTIKGLYCTYHPHNYYPEIYTSRPLDWDQQIFRIRSTIEDAFWLTFPLR